MDVLAQIHNFTIAELKYILTYLGRKYDMKFFSKKTRKWDMVELLENQYYNPLLEKRIEYLKSSIMSLHQLFKFASDFHEEIILNQFHQASYYHRDVPANNLRLCYKINNDLLKKGWKVFLFIGPYPSITELQDGRIFMLKMIIPPLNFIKHNNSDLTNVIQGTHTPMELVADINEEFQYLNLCFPPLKGEFIKGFILSIRLIKMKSDILDVKKTETAWVDWSVKGVSHPALEIDNLLEQVNGIKSFKGHLKKLAFYELCKLNNIKTADELYDIEIKRRNYNLAHLLALQEREKEVMFDLNSMLVEEKEKAKKNQIRYLVEEKTSVRMYNLTLRSKKDMCF
ncbi:hypothetical protein BC833DRAFT_625668 [Globomyces pollinis-pini]|nr:hypothetical protein BC833DRAFT_625668 [Globomyces pollinis-pini]